ncbi:MAG: class I SAM-dependent methyltransferase [Ginsengibacter sp.]
MSNVQETTPLAKHPKWIDVKGKRITKQEEMDFTYTNIDKMIRLSLGENAHFSGAYYNGDFSISLEEAQRRKYVFVCEQLGIKQGTKVLDVGCGWGGFLKHLKELGADGTGITLSTGQLETCHRNGFKAYLKDVRFIEPEDFGTFDAVAAIGSFDHVATIEDHLKGRQDEVYDSYFKHIAGVLPKGGRFFLQSMVFGKNMIPYEEFDISAPKDSAPFILALLTKHHPDSWLPYGGEHIERAAAPYFKVIHHNSGRLDYIETQKQWQKRFLRFSWKKYLWFLSLAPKLIYDKEFRYQWDMLKIFPTRVCFEREIWEHSRIVFEKI